MAHLYMTKVKGEDVLGRTGPRGPPPPHPNNFQLPVALEFGHQKTKKKQLLPQGSRAVLGDLFKGDKGSGFLL